MVCFICSFPLLTSAQIVRECVSDDTDAIQVSFFNINVIYFVCNQAPFKEHTIGYTKLLILLVRLVVRILRAFV